MLNQHWRDKFVLPCCLEALRMLFSISGQNGGWGGGEGVEFPSTSQLLKQSVTVEETRTGRHPAGQEGGRGSLQTLTSPRISSELVSALMEQKQKKKGHQRILKVFTCVLQISEALSFLLSICCKYLQLPLLLAHPGVWGPDVCQTAGSPVCNSKLTLEERETSRSKKEVIGHSTRDPSTPRAAKHGVEELLRSSSCSRSAQTHREFVFLKLYGASTDPRRACSWRDACIQPAAISLVPAEHPLLWLADEDDWWCCAPTPGSLSRVF